MAIVDLGTQQLIIGASPVLYTPFAYDFTQAYLIGAVFSASTFNTIFSNVHIDVLLNPTPTFQFVHPEPVVLQIRPGVQSFFIPMSELFLSSGTATIRAERKPFTFGGADSPTLVGLNLIYDDAITVPSWRN